MAILEEVFEKVVFKKISAQDKKKMKNLPGVKELNGGDKYIMKGILILACTFCSPPEGSGPDPEVGLLQYQDNPL